MSVPQEIIIDIAHDIAVDCCNRGIGCCTFPPAIFILTHSISRCYNVSEERNVRDDYE
jgi:hypothetical protein